MTALCRRVPLATRLSAALLCAAGALAAIAGPAGGALGRVGSVPTGAASVTYTADGTHGGCAHCPAAQAGA